MDASSFHWIEGEVWYLHVAIDDADGKVVGAYFDHQETLKGIMRFFIRFLLIMAFLQCFIRTDALYLNKKRKDKPSDAEDTFTQFSYACHNLGIEIKLRAYPKQKEESKDSTRRSSHDYQSN